MKPFIAPNDFYVVRIKDTQEYVSSGGLFYSDKSIGRAKIFQNHDKAKSYCDDKPDHESISIDIIIKE